MSIPRTNNPDNAFQITHAGRIYTFANRGTADHIAKTMQRFGTFYELDLLEAISTIAGQSGTIAIDCGANIGNHSIYFSAVCGYQVFSFEPVPENYALLEKNVRANTPTEGLTLEMLAIGGSERDVELGTSDIGNPGTYSVSSKVGGVLAKQVTLDGYLTSRQVDPKAIAILKIDVEGHEKEVLSGATATLETGHPLVSLELPGTSAYAQVEPLLNALGYAPVSVHCWTPTVLFRKSEPDAAALDRVMKRLDKFDRKHRARAIQ